MLVSRMLVRFFGLVGASSGGCILLRNSLRSGGREGERRILHPLGSNVRARYLLVRLKCAFNSIHGTLPVLEGRGGTRARAVCWSWEMPVSYVVPGPTPKPRKPPPAIVVRGCFKPCALHCHPEGACT